MGHDPPNPDENPEELWADIITSAPAGKEPPVITQIGKNAEVNYTPGHTDTLRATPATAQVITPLNNFTAHFVKATPQQVNTLQTAKNLTNGQYAGP